MPAGDRTGPEGKGTRTGRGLGSCGGDAPVAGQGFGRGGGAGRGLGRGAGRGAGRGRGLGRNQVANNG